MTPGGGTRHPPQAQDVVREVVVQLEEAGKQRTAGGDDRHALEAGRRGLPLALHGGDLAGLDVDDAVVDDALAAVSATGS